MDRMRSNPLARWTRRQKCIFLPKRAIAFAEEVADFKQTCALPYINIRMNKRKETGERERERERESYSLCIYCNM